MNTKYTMQKNLISKSVLLCCIIMMFWSCIEQKNDHVSETNVAQKPESVQVVKKSDYEKLMIEGDAAFLDKNYLKAVFKYKQALEYEPNHIEAYVKLIVASEKSCTSGNELHCNSKDLYRKRIALIQQFGVVDTTDKSTWISTTIRVVNDSIKIEIDE